MTVNKATTILWGFVVCGIRFTSKSWIVFKPGKAGQKEGEALIFRASPVWWSQQDSNLWPHRCERCALPTEPCDHVSGTKYSVLLVLDPSVIPCTETSMFYQLSHTTLFNSMFLQIGICGATTTNIISHSSDLSTVFWKFNSLLKCKVTIHGLLTPSHRK